MRKEEKGRRAAGRRTLPTDAAARFSAWAVLALGFCFICVSGAAQAETVSPACPERPANATRARDAARTWFETAEALVEEELFSEALGAFNCSLRMTEHPATMMNAARAAELAGNKTEALDLYKRAAAATPEAGKATFAQERIAALEAEIGGAPPPEPAVKSGPEPEVAPKPETPVEGDTGRSGSMLAAPGYAAVVVGGVGVVLGTVLAGLAGKAKKDGEATTSYAEFQDDKDKMEGMRTGAIVSFAVGGAALAVGIVMIVGANRNGKKSETPAAVEVAVSPGIGGFTVGGEF